MEKSGEGILLLGSMGREGCDERQLEKEGKDIQLYL